jgi:hypothetical protein
VSRFKEHVNLENHKVKGLRSVLIRTPVCVIAMLLAALTAIKLGKPGQKRVVIRLA